ncbi:MAG: tRNA (adenosine(37)-N6)-dimethylallyltransferase MiaA, partial [Phenylobacterium sp.]|nr:tRNA (adenosine(37)-N6)-dimethylallyltransferase MiaA [Phenylobacterium sp.]
EVFAASGTSLSDWQARTRPLLAPGSWRGVVLDPPRAALYARCDARLEAMVREGALEEVRALVARGLSPELPAMKAVGVRELAEHLAGRAGLAEALAAAQRETRRYVKRQSTWLRGRMDGWPRITALEPEAQWGQFLALNPSLTP